MALIKLENVSKVFKTGNIETVAVDDASLTIKKGDSIAILGPSGSGKSTLMHIIGLLDTPTGGSYKLNNKPVINYKDKHLAELRRKKVGFIFQTFNLVPRLTAAQNVELPMVYARTRPGKRTKRALMLLEQVGIDREHASKQPNQLSGGQTQRVAIARALANNPDIILADEPTGNLDSKTGAQVINVLKKLNRAGNTLIIVTHDPALAKVAKRVIQIKDGKLQEGKS